MRNLQEVVEDAEFVQNLERRGMHSVASKVTEKILVLL